MFQTEISENRISTEPFIPFSTVLGGGVAGYHEGLGSAAGAKVCASAGPVSFVPFVAIIAVVLVSVPVAPGPGGGAQFAVWGLGLLIALVAAIYMADRSICLVVDPPPVLSIRPSALITPQSMPHSRPLSSTCCCSHSTSASNCLTDTEDLFISA